MDKETEGSRPREQKCKRSRNAEVQETPWVLGITGGTVTLTLSGSLLQEHTAGGKGEQGLIVHFIPRAGQATGNGNYLKTLSSCMSAVAGGKSQGCGGPMPLRN